MTHLADAYAYSAIFSRHDGVPIGCLVDYGASCNWTGVFGVENMAINAVM